LSNRQQNSFGVYLSHMFRPTWHSVDTEISIYKYLTLLHYVFKPLLNLIKSNWYCGSVDTRYG